MADTVAKSWTWGVLLIVLTCAAYAYTTRCGWIWDDPSYVTENQTLVDAAGLKRIWLEQRANAQYYPLVFTTFWIEYQLWQLKPTGYHVVNVLLHALGALLWWRLLTRLGVEGAWIAAAVFALHPVHVESVAWVTERKNVLSGVFYVSALLAWIRYCPLHQDLPGEQRNHKAYVAAIVLYVCALLSKSVTATLPAVILLGLWWQRGKLRAIGRRDLLALAPMFVVGIAFGLNTVWLEKHHVGAQGFEWDYTLFDRVLIAGRALWFYADKLVWPAELVFIYPRWTIQSVSVAQWLYPAGAVGIMLGLWLARRRVGLGPLVGVLFFAGTLFPALGFFDVFPMRYSFVADHFQYLASMGLIAVAAAGLTRLFRSAHPAGVIAAAVLLAALGVRTWAQTHQYSNEQVLWETTLRYNPNAAIAYNNLGNILDRQGDAATAMQLYQQAIKLAPSRAQAYHNIGELLRNRGDVKAAVPYYEKAVERLPTYTPMRLSLAVALKEAGELDRALPHFEEVVERSPDLLVAREFLGDAYVELRRPADALPHYLHVLAFDRTDAHLMSKTAHLLIVAGRGEEAAALYREALQLKPDERKLKHGLALALASIGQDKQAVAILQQLLASDSEAPEALKLLAMIRFAHGETDQAIALAQKAMSAATKRGNHALAANIGQHLQQYRAATIKP